MLFRSESRPTSWTRHFLPRRVRLAYARERAVEQGRSGRSCPLLLLCARHSVWICCELVGVGCPFVVLVNTVMSVILAIAITAIAAITAIIKPIRQPSFSPDSFSIGLPVACHNSRRLVKGARRKSAKEGRGLRPEPPRGRGVLKVRARQFCPRKSIICGLIEKKRLSVGCRVRHPGGRQLRHESARGASPLP